MRLYRVLAAAGVLVTAALPSFASAQVESTPIPTTAKPDFSSMTFLVGTWSCSTKSARRPAPYVTSVTYAMDPTGYWLEQTSITSATSWSPKGTVWDKITYDPYTKRWVDVSYGDQGAYALSFSSGWRGTKMTWHDVSFAPTSEISAQSDTTNTKVSSTKVTTSSTFTEAKTGRRVGVTGVCTKH